VPAEAAAAAAERKRRRRMIKEGNKNGGGNSGTCPWVGRSRRCGRRRRGTPRATTATRDWPHKQTHTRSGGSGVPYWWNARGCRRTFARRPRALCPRLGLPPLSHRAHPPHHHLPPFSCPGYGCYPPFSCPGYGSCLPCFFLGYGCADERTFQDMTSRRQAVAAT
jgi:hypothetical protein